MFIPVEKHKLNDNPIMDAKTALNNLFTHPDYAENIGVLHKELMLGFLSNLGIEPNNYRYSTILKDIGYLNKHYGSPKSYSLFQQNLDGMIPSISSIDRHVTDSFPDWIAPELNVLDKDRVGISN